MVEAMYENSPDYFKKFQKRFKYSICDTEPKDSWIKNYVRLSFVFDCYWWFFVWFQPLASFFEDQVRKIILFFLRMLLRQYLASWIVLNSLFCLMVLLFLLLLVLLFFAGMSLWSTCQSLIMFQPTKLKNNFLCLILWKDSQPLLLQL